MRIVMIGSPRDIDTVAGRLRSQGLTVVGVIPIVSVGDSDEVTPTTARVFAVGEVAVVALGAPDSMGGVEVPLADLDTHLRCAAALPRLFIGGIGDLRVMQLEDRIERLTDRLAQTEEALQKAKRRYRTLTGRRSVRLAVRLATFLRPALLAVRAVRNRWRRVTRRSDPSDAARPSLTRDDVIRGVRAARPAVYPTQGPLVSIIILTRNGADHLRVLFPALAGSAYRSFEVVVVDNASNDDTDEVVDGDWPFPVTAVRNERNTSFSLGNNQAAERASGELLLFLNNDVEPITEHWLGAMVAASAGREDPPAAVGALLVYPAVGDPAKHHTVQHRGIGFGFRASGPYAFNLTGTDPTDPSLAGVREVAGASAAALLVSRLRFDAVGGFTGGYGYGAEDVDLCLKLRRYGPILLQGDAVLFHHESATQAGSAGSRARARRLINWQQYAETWAPTIGRSVRRDRLTGAGKWTGDARRPRVAITLTHDDETKRYGDYYTAHELGDALTALGWEVHYAERYRDGWDDLPEGLDMLVGLLDSFDARRVGPDVVKVAWVRDWVERWIERPWLDAYDVVVAGSAAAAAAIRAVTRFDPPVVPLASNPERFAPGEPAPSLSADYAFTGHRWGVEPALAARLEVRRGERFALYGKGWGDDRALKRHWRGVLDYDDLPALYRSVKVVLDDTAGPTIGHGLVDSRVFDALAAGALVLTDNRAGSDEVFDGLLPVYEDGAGLRRLLDHYLASDAERSALVARLRAVVLERHTYSRRAQRLVDLAVRSVDVPRLAVKIGAPDRDTAHHWGDMHFANGLIRAMGRRGFHGEVHLLPDWDAPERQDADVVVHLRGLGRYRPKPSAVNVLWVISHPDQVTPEEASAFDLVCVASPLLAEALDGSVDAPVILLPQASDAARFGAATATDELRSEVLFVGNTRNQRRAAVEWALEAGLPLTVYGGGWEGKVPRDALRAGYFPNERLPDLYASAGVVLNDHWPDMLEYGVVSNRIFDVLASGGVVVSDPVPGLDDLFDNAVPTYRDAEEMGEIVRRLLDDPAQRAALAERGRRAVLDGHTFEHRAHRLTELVRPLLERRPLDCDGARFSLGAGDSTRAAAQPPTT